MSKWTFENAKGEIVSWYSEEEMQKAKNKLNRIEYFCSNYPIKTLEALSIKRMILRIIKESEEK